MSAKSSTCYKCQTDQSKGHMPDDLRLFQYKYGRATVPEPMIFEKEGEGPGLQISRIFHDEREGRHGLTIL